MVVTMPELAWSAKEVKLVSACISLAENNAAEKEPERLPECDHPHARPMRSAIIKATLECSLENVCQTGAACFSRTFQWHHPLQSSHFQHFSRLS